MKRWIKLYVCTLRKDLSIILAVAILFIFAMDMWLKNIPAPNSFFVAMGNFWYALSIAYVSSFVFYFFVVHYSRQKEKLILYKHIGESFYIVIKDCKTIFDEMLFKSGLNIDSENMTEDEICKMCSKIRPLSATNVINRDGSSMNWLEYFNFYKKNIDKRIDIILLQMPYLDVEFVGIINQFKPSSFFETMEGLRIAYNTLGAINKNFGNGAEQSFILFYRLFKTSFHYYNKEFKRYLE